MAHRLSDGGGSTSLNLTVDAVVAATALQLPEPAIVLTSDPQDLEHLLADISVRVEKIG